MIEPDQNRENRSIILQAMECVTLYSLFKREITAGKKGVASAAACGFGIPRITCHACHGS